jgi:peptide/nickel transport system substrate-binding protein
VRTLGFRDKLIVFTLMAIAAGSLAFWFGAVYTAMTTPLPAIGGSYTEGVVGQPAYINPLFAQTSEADADLSQLIYSGLFAYDTQGVLRESLAEKLEVSEEGKRYTVTLRKGVKWHDGQEIQADDAVFTFRIIQDPAYKSPLRQNWQGVEVETVDDYTLAFVLKKPYFGFLDNLTVGILPKHIWENITPEKFSLTDYNLSPVGSGPYQFFDFKKDSSGNILSYEVRAFSEYFEHAPYISKIVFRFYPDEDALIDAYNRREVMGMSNLVPEKEALLQDRKSTQVYALRQPRLFAVFFNELKSASLAQKEVRQALSWATDRQAIVDTVFKGRALSLDSPFLPQMAGYIDATEGNSFDPEKANRIFEEAGWVMKDGVREKNGVRLEFSLTTPDWPELAKTAEILKSQWEQVGARVTVNTLGVADLQQSVLRPREYEALLFGEAATSFNPDPYSFWHSSQKRDPGLNLAMFDHKEADTLLTDAREVLDETKRKEKYAEFQRIFAQEMPAVFLYSPAYLYVVNSQVQGIAAENINAPSNRFQDVWEWYVKTKRVKK